MTVDPVDDGTPKAAKRLADCYRKLRDESFGDYEYYARKVREYKSRCEVSMFWAEKQKQESK